MTKAADINDNCPDWAKEQILQLIALEIKLGNITKDENWTDKQMDSLLNNAFDKLSENSRIEEEIESLFAQICVGLNKEACTPEQIASYINDRATSKSSKLAYCSPEEVKEAF